VLGKKPLAEKKRFSAEKKKIAPSRKKENPLRPLSTTTRKGDVKDQRRASEERKTVNLLYSGRPLVDV